MSPRRRTGSRIDSISCSLIVNKKDLRSFPEVIRGSERGSVEDMDITPDKNTQDRKSLP